MDGKLSAKISLIIVYQPARFSNHHCLCCVSESMSINNWKGLIMRSKMLQYWVLSFWKYIFVICCYLWYAWSGSRQWPGRAASCPASTATPERIKSIKSTKSIKNNSWKNQKNQKHKKHQRQHLNASKTSKALTASKLPKGSKHQKYQKHQMQYLKHQITKISTWNIENSKDQRHQITEAAKGATDTLKHDEQNCTYRHVKVDELARAVGREKTRGLPHSRSPPDSLQIF